MPFTIRVDIIKWLKPSLWSTKVIIFLLKTYK